MKALIYYELIPKASDYSFEKPFLKWFKKEFPEVSALDLDQYSDQSLFCYSKKVFDEADQVILVIDGALDVKAEKLTGLNEAAIKNKEKAFCLLRFQSPFIEKMFRILGNNKFLMSEDLKMQETFVKNVIQGRQ